MYIQKAHLILYIYSTCRLKTRFSYVPEIFMTSHSFIHSFVGQMVFKHLVQELANCNPQIECSPLVFVWPCQLRMVFMFFKSKEQSYFLTCESRV